MKPIQDQNHQFNALDGLLDGQKAYLIEQGRVVVTNARFSRSEALADIGLAALDSDFGVTADNRLSFGGHIILKRPYF